MGRMTLAPSPGDSGLASLPFDVARMIVWDEQLSLGDVAALRLTCRSFTTAATTRLFYCIAISKLNKDRDAFLAICHSPHLAQHVHEVEWLEVCYDVDVFDRLGTPLPSTTNAQEDDTAAVCRYFDDQAKTSFWMANLPTLAGNPDAASIEEARRDAVAEFRAPFLAAIDLLPNLHTFISQQMPSTWAVNSAPEYPMTADLFQRYPRDSVEEAASQSNDGLIFFLLPAMERLTSTVTRLRWADELPGRSYVRLLPAAAFDGLESLDLCFSRSGVGPHISLDHFADACARAAPTLRRLTLCVAHGENQSSCGTAGHIVLGPALARSPSCHLRSLSLVSTRCSDEVLLGLFEAHADTLRHVYLGSIDVGVQLVRRLAGLASLKLDSIEVVNEGSRAVCARALARYINGEPIGGGPGMCCSVSDGEESRFGACDRELRRLVEGVTTRLPLATAAICEDWASDRGSDAESDASEDSVDYRRRTGPKWVWSRFFPADKSFPAGVYCFQVPDSHPRGHATECWKFTSRDGETACGADPLEWFDEWDVDAGDVEEPTPYCEALREFWDDGSRTEMRMGSLASYLGEDSAAWRLIQQENPPAGAVYYHEQLDPFKDASGLGTRVTHAASTGWGSSWRTVEYP